MTMQRTNQSGNKKDTIPKKLRFEVFKRDSFTCIYCGRRPPEVVLHADHRIPEAGGGETTILNLVTSCLDCNLGKGATPLDDHAFVAKHHDNAAEMQERREQLQMIADWYHDLSHQHDELQQVINAFFNRRVPGCGIAPGPLQKIARFAEKHQAVDCVFDAIADLAAENVSFDEPGKASKDCAEYIVSRLEHVARNKLALKGLPLVQNEEGQARYLFGILRNKSRMGELPHSVRFYEIVNGILASGRTIAELTHAAKESRGFKHWRQQFDDDDFPTPATKCATPVPRTSQTVTPRSATRTASPAVQPAVPALPGAPTAFDEAMLQGYSHSMPADEATAHLLNACTAFLEFLAEIAGHDFAEEWAKRAGPWIDQVYVEMRAAIKDIWPEVASLDAAARQAEIESSVESTFELFFDGPFEAQVTPAITFLLKRAKRSEYWHAVVGEYRLRELNKWLCTRLKMARYHCFEARISNVPMESEEEVETLQESMDMLCDARIPFQQSVLDMIETPGHCEEMQNYALHVFGQTVVQLGLKMCKGPVDPRLPELILQTISNAAQAMASLLLPHQGDDDSNIRGGKEWLAEQSPYRVYVELAMTTGIVFPENCDLQAVLIELRDSLQVAEEDFLMLVDAGGSPEIGAYARHLLAEAAGPFPTDIPS
jgi:hypothetical protein